MKNDIRDRLTEAFGIPDPVRKDEFFSKLEEAQEEREKDDKAMALLFTFGDSGKTEKKQSKLPIILKIGSIAAAAAAAFSIWVAGKATPDLVQDHHNHPDYITETEFSTETHTTAAPDEQQPTDDEEPTATTAATEPATKKGRTTEPAITTAGAQTETAGTGTQTQATQSPGFQGTAASPAPTSPSSPETGRTPESTRAHDTGRSHETATTAVSTRAHGSSATTAAVTSSRTVRVTTTASATSSKSARITTTASAVSTGPAATTIRTKSTEKVKVTSVPKATTAEAPPETQTEPVRTKPADNIPTPTEGREDPSTDPIVAPIEEPGTDQIEFSTEAATYVPAETTPPATYVYPPPAMTQPATRDNGSNSVEATEPVYTWPSGYDTPNCTMVPTQPAREDVTPTTPTDTYKKSIHNGDYYIDPVNALNTPSYCIPLSELYNEERTSDNEYGYDKFTYLRYIRYEQAFVGYVDEVFCTVNSNGTNLIVQNVTVLDALYGDVEPDDVCSVVTFGGYKKADKLSDYQIEKIKDNSPDSEISQYFIETDDGHYIYDGPSYVYVYDDTALSREPRPGDICLFLTYTLQDKLLPARNSSQGIFLLHSDYFQNDRYTDYKYTMEEIIAFFQKKKEDG
ncbi:MAG: hypothetical protein J5501_03960 [Ruminococcus sp.]|nr:hypothetical protein [Ruminococcus sp.]